MKGLDSIIRLQEWKLDEKRRKVADLERLAQRLHDQIASLEREVRDEQKIAAKDAMAARGYGHYANAVIQRREKLLKSLAGVEQEMAVALDEVAAAFREFKKFDLIRERNRAREEVLEKRRQQSELDEAGLGVYRRRKN
jgi:flagellar FliJ protein